MGAAPAIVERGFGILLDGIAPDIELRTAYDQLKPTERVFVDEYVATDDPRGAAMRSAAPRDQERYSRPSVADLRATEIMKRPLVQAAIAERMKAAMDRLDISADRVLQEVAKLAFSNMGDYVRITGEGEPYTDLSGVNRDQMAAVSEVTTEDYTEGRGEDARDVKKVKIKLHDKSGALDKLMKYHGLYAAEKHELSGPNGTPIQTRNVNINVETSLLDAADIYARSLQQ